MIILFVTMTSRFNSLSLNRLFRIYVVVVYRYSKKKNAKTHVINLRFVYNLFSFVATLSNNFFFINSTPEYDIRHTLTRR